MQTYAASVTDWDAVYTEQERRAQDLAEFNAAYIFRELEHGGLAHLTALLRRRASYPAAQPRAIDVNQTSVGQPALWQEAKASGRPFLVYGQGNPCPLERARDDKPGAKPEAKAQAGALNAAMQPGERWRSLYGRLDSHRKAPAGFAEFIDGFYLENTAGAPRLAAQVLARFALTNTGRLIEVKKGGRVKEHAAHGKRRQHDVKRKAFRWQPSNAELLSAVWPEVPGVEMWAGPTAEEFNAQTPAQRADFENDFSASWLGDLAETVKAEGDKDLLTFTGELPKSKTPSISLINREEMA